MKLYHITHKENVESILLYGIISMFNRTSCFSNSRSLKKYDYLPFTSPVFLTGDIEYAIKCMGSWNKMEDLAYIVVDVPSDSLHETDFDFELVHSGTIFPENIISHSIEIPTFLNAYWVQ